VGISFALGAFVAGMILSESEFCHQALHDVTPLRDIFGLLFFVTVGMLFDPNYVLAHLGQIGIAVVSILIGKAVILGGLARAFGYRNMAPWVIGLGMAQIGEFSFVLARSGLGSGMLSKNTYDLALTCTIVTMAVSPLLSTVAVPLGRFLRGKQKAAPAIKTFSLPDEALRDHVVVAGYGRTGRTVARVLRASGLPLIVVESEYALLDDITADGLPGVWADITHDEVLHAARIERARILVLAIPDRETVRSSVERARRLNPGLVVIARAVREHHVAELQALGVDAVVQPEFEGGIEMVRQALVRFQYDDAEALRVIGGLRKELYGETG